MTELEAGEYHHFPSGYDHALAEGLGHRLDVALAWLNDNLVGAAAPFMTYNVMAHYHLSATNDLDRTSRACALSQGCDRLRLGGGVCGEDKLFAFNRSFGG